MAKCANESESKQKKFFKRKSTFGSKTTLKVYIWNKIWETVHFKNDFLQ